MGKASLRLPSYGVGKRREHGRTGHPLVEIATDKVDSEIFAPGNEKSENH
jgi:hypothetical protein